MIESDACSTIHPLAEMLVKKDHLEIILEDISSKFNLVLEGHEALRSEIRETRAELNEKIDHNSFMIGVLNDKIDTVDRRLSDKIEAVEEKLSKRIDAVEEKLSNKIDGVASDLSAHRADTEAHHGVYRVKEEGEEFGK